MTEKRWWPLRFQQKKWSEQDWRQEWVYRENKEDKDYVGIYIWEQKASGWVVGTQKEGMFTLGKLKNARQAQAFALLLYAAEEGPWKK